MAALIEFCRGVGLPEQMITFAIATALFCLDLYLLAKTAETAVNLCKSIDRFADYIVDEVKRSE